MPIDVLPLAVSGSGGHVSETAERLDGVVRAALRAATAAAEAAGDPVLAGALFDLRNTLRIGGVGLHMAQAAAGRALATAAGRYVDTERTITAAMLPHPVSDPAR